MTMHHLQRRYESPPDSEEPGQCPCCKCDTYRFGDDGEHLECEDCHGEGDDDE